MDSARGLLGEFLEAFLKSANQKKNTLNAEFYITRKTRMSRETIAFHREFCAKGARNNFSAVRLLINFDKGCFCVVYPCSENKLEVFAFDIFSVLRLCDGISPHCSIVVCLVISQTKRISGQRFGTPPLIDMKDISNTEQFEFSGEANEKLVLKTPITKLVPT